MWYVTRHPEHNICHESEGGGTTLGILEPPHIERLATAVTVTVSRFKTSTIIAYPLVVTMWISLKAIESNEKYHSLWEMLNLVLYFFYACIIILEIVMRIAGLASFVN